MIQNAITVIELWPMVSECCICGRHLVGCHTSIAMYEGVPVPDDWEGDWAGFDACQACFDKHSKGELPMWRKKECL